MIKTSDIFYLNEKGARENNEDAIWPQAGTASPGNRLFIVCDGVGGNSAGEVAATLTCEYFAGYFMKRLGDTESAGKEFIKQAHEYTLTHFKDHIEKNPTARDMSTTLTLAYLNPASVTVAWCGDSRIYQLRNGEVVFQSTDHSLVNQLLKAGGITEAEAQHHPQKNMILRAIQYKDKPSAIEVVELTDVKAGDHFLLCTDGLLENIDGRRLTQIIAGEQKNLAAAIDAICSGNTKDNYSMYLFKIINE